MIPIGRDSLLSRFPWATLLVVLAATASFLGTWPAERAFLAARWPDSPLVTSAKDLASLALDDGSTLPAELRTRLEDLRVHPHFPDAEGVELLQAVQKNFVYLPTLKRPHWNPLYEKFLKAKNEADAVGTPWRSVFSRYVLRSEDPLWPRLATYPWVHAGILHLLFSLFFIWLAGSFMEDVWGSFLTLFLVFTGPALGGAALHFAFPGGAWTLLGASGAAAALLGGMAARDPGSPLRFFYALGVGYGTFSLPAWTALVLWVPLAVQTGWLTGGRLEGAAAGWVHGTAFGWGAVVGLLTRLRRRKAGDSPQEASSGDLDRRAEAAARLFSQGKMEDAAALYRQNLAADGAHVPSLQGVLPVFEALRLEDDAAGAAVRLIRTALERGRGQMAEDVFRRWSMKLFQARLPLSEKLVLAQNLETMQLWREALAYYRAVSDQGKDTPFAGKAFFSSAKIHKDQFKKPDDAAHLLRMLLDPPYDVEWRALAEAELRSMGKL